MRRRTIDSARDALCSSMFHRYLWLGKTFLVTFLYIEIDLKLHIICSTLRLLYYLLHDYLSHVIHYIIISIYDVLYYSLHSIITLS